MSRTHGPITQLGICDLAGWLEMRKAGIRHDPRLLVDHLPQGVLTAAHVEQDPMDGSPVIAATIQPIRPERLHQEDREGDNSAARPRLRYWDPEAFLVIRLALVNGGTMFVDDDGHGSEDDSRRAWHYPEIFAEGILLHRVLMGAGQGERVRVIVDRSHPYGHRDCRMRRLYIEEGPAAIRRGVAEFLDIAMQTYAKPNTRDGMTGPERFGADPEAYRKILEDALALNRRLNPPASVEAIARWRAARHPA